MPRYLIAFILLIAGCATPPAEVRVAFDRNRVIAIHAAGFADRAAHRRVGADDPVRLASVSKLIVALGVMRLVEAGTLDIDRDVSGYLGWQLRNPAYPDKAVTLRLLLSHKSSLRDGIDYAIPLDGTVRAAVADSKAWDAAHPPGAYFTYANINFPVIASVMEAATSERFDKLIARLVFAPLGLHGCFNWTTCDSATIGRAVVLYDEKGTVLRDDLKGVPPACPAIAHGACDLTHYQPGSNGALFSPQGGARVSMRDLSRIGQMLLKNGDGFLSPGSISLMEAPFWTFDGTNGETENGFYCRYGLAMQTLATHQKDCRDDLFGDHAERTGHAGEAYGVRSGLWIDRSHALGVAFFATALGEDAPKGRHSAFTAAEERLGR